MTDTAGPTVCVVIVSYRTPALTHDCVRSIRDHAGDIPCRIIVVDNASGDETAADLRRAFPEICVIDAPCNGGFAYGNALGLVRAREDFVLLLNPDAQLRPGALQAALAHLVSHPGDGVVGANARFADGTIDNSTIRFPGLDGLLFGLVLPGRFLANSRRFGDPRYASLDRTMVQQVDAVSGCFMLLRRAVLETAGWLDPRFFLYGEEVEWCLRIRRAGWGIVFHPAVHILHVGGASTNPGSVWQAIEMMRGQLLYFRLARGAGTARVAAALMALRDLLRLPAFAMLRLLGRRGNGLEIAWRRMLFGIAAAIMPPAGQRPADLPGLPPQAIRKMWRTSDSGN